MWSYVHVFYKLPNAGDFAMCRHVSNEMQSRIESSLAGLFALASESGWRTLLQAAREAGEHNLQQRAPQVDCDFARAMWVWLFHPEIFERARAIHAVVNATGRRLRDEAPNRGRRRKHARTIRQRKRASRTALIELLRREIEEHLRSARDYARATQDRTGTPLLLPRPSMEHLARRFRVHKSTISRCLRDKGAATLRMLWDVAADLDRILGAAGERS
jgi:hypothetical protein